MGNPTKALQAARDYVFDRSRVNYLKAYLKAASRTNAVFIWIPKTAGTSLYSILKAPALLSLEELKFRFPGRGTVTFGHMDYAQLVEAGYVSQSFDSTAYKFAIARNPYARAVSLYLYVVVRLEGEGKMSFLEFCRQLKREGCPPIGLYNVLGWSQCNPQVRWTEKVDLDFLGKVETLDRDVEGILANIGLPSTSVPKINRSRRGDEIASYYCPESKEIVEDFYREDFATFGYPKEDFLDASAQQ